MRIQFGSYWLDDQRFILERDGARVSIRPKVFDLLAYLIREHDRVVPREELVEALWGGAMVGMGSLSGLVNELRKVLREEGRGPSSIRTVHARGYQFVAELEWFAKEEPDRTQRPALSGNSPGPHPRVLEEGLPLRNPSRLPASIERALWLHLREDPQRIEKVEAWLVQLRSEATAFDQGRLRWKHTVDEHAQPVRTMRTVAASASSSMPETSSSSGVRGPAREQPSRDGESSRSA